MKIMVTGGAGFIGSHIVDILIEKGHEVVVIDNLTTGDKCNINPKAVFYQADIMHESFDIIIKHEAPEVIFHEAALVYVQQSIKDPVADANVNIIGTLNVLNSAHRHNVKKIIFASTCAVYGNGELEGVKEEHLKSPISFYGMSKLSAEKYIKLYCEIFNIDYTILRYANVYGPRQKPHGEGGVIPLFIENIIKGMQSTIYGDGNQTRDFIYVSDVAKANLMALNKASKQIINIGTGIGITINYLYKELNTIMESNVTVNYMPDRMGDARHIALDPLKAQALLDWKASTLLKEGIEKTLAFYNEERIVVLHKGGS